MAVLSSGMQLMGASTSTQQIVKGLVLLVAVAFDVYNKRRAPRRSVIGDAARSGGAANGDGAPYVPARCFGC